MDSERSASRSLSRGWRRAAVVVGWLTAALVALGVTAYVARAPLLTWIGGQLVHIDPVEAADAIVVLAGSEFAEREIAAVDLYLAGYAPRLVLTTGSEPRAMAALKVRKAEIWSPLQVRLSQLRDLGMPEDAVTVLGEVVESTFEEATLLAAWADREQIESLIIVTAMFHSARARFIFRRVFDDRPVRLLMHPTTLDGFRPETWWRNRTTLRAGLFEWQKTVFYRLWYW